MMKKKISVILSVVLMVLALSLAFTGCKKDGDTLHIINFRPEDQKFYEYANKEFEKKTGKKVVYECVDTTNYSNLLTSRLNADAVDVFGTDPANILSEQIFEKMDVLDDLKYSNGSSLWDNVTDFEISQVSSNGHKYIAPLGSVTELVYYRKDVMALINPEQVFANKKYPTTYNEFIGALNFFKQKENTGVIDGVFAFGGLDVWPVSMIMGSLEPSIVRAENPNFYLQLAKSEVTFDNTLYRTYITRAKEILSYISSKATGQSYKLTPNMFGLSNKKYAFMIDGSWSIPQVLTANPNAQIGFFPVPGSDDANDNKVVAAKSGAAMCIAKTSQKRELAKEYIEFLYSKEVYQKYVNSAMVVPAIKGVTHTENIELMQELYQFPTILLSENMPLPGLPIADTLRAIGADFITKPGYTVENAISDLNGPVVNQSSWKEERNLKPWFDRFYPGEGRSEW